MPLSLVIGWFTLGFAVAAVLLHGPVAAKALLAMKRENDYARKYVGLQDKHIKLLKEYQGLAREHGELQDKYQSVLEEYNALGQEMLAEREEVNAFLKKYEALLIEHKALLWRAGGGVEGTA